MQPQSIDPRTLRPEDLRAAARFVEETVIAALDRFDDLANAGFRLPIGNGRDTPRLAPERRAAARGVDVLRNASNDAVAALHALALASEQGVDLPAAVFLPVEPYLVAYLEERATGEINGNRGQDLATSG